MGRKVRPAVHDKPAVGLEVNGEIEAVAAALLRASSQGYEVLLACDDHHREIAQFSDVLEATVIDYTAQSGSVDPLERIVEVAFDQGYPGLIYHRDVTSPVDYEASEETWRQESGYIVEAERKPRDASSPGVVVAIPAYNEEDSIGNVVSECRQYADEVLVIDDGSDDRTGERAKAAGATVVHHQGNKGYGAAVKSSFEKADRMGAEQLVLVDGDGQHNPADIPKLLRKQKETEAHIVIGSRFIGEGNTTIPRYRRLGLAVVNTLTNVYFQLVGGDLRISDTQCGFRAYDERAIRSLAQDHTITDDMDASIEILYHACHHDFDIVEVETSVNYDLDDASSYNPVYHGTILMRNIILNLERIRPTVFPGILGLLSIGFGTGLAVWSLSGLVPIVVLLVMVVAGLSILVGAFLMTSAVVSRALLIHRRP